jgi:hypothetical protein
MDASETWIPSGLLAKAIHEVSHHPFLIESRVSVHIRSGSRATHQVSSRKEFHVRLQFRIVSQCVVFVHCAYLCIRLLFWVRLFAHPRGSTLYTLRLFVCIIRLNGTEVVLSYHSVFLS